MKFDDEKSEFSVAGTLPVIGYYNDNESAMNLDVLYLSNMSTTNNHEVVEKVRARRTQDSNQFSVCMNALRSFQNNNLNHMIVSSPSVKKSNDKSFNQFILLSALPRDLLSHKYELASIGNLSRPAFIKAVNVVDKYPLTSPDSSFSTEEVASVCFPSGVQCRFIPRCAKEMALKKGLLGKEGDRYQLHTVRIISKYLAIF